MDGLGAELSRAKIGRVGYLVTGHEVLEEREDVELRKGGRVLRGHEAEDPLAGLVVLAFEEGAGGTQKKCQLDDYKLEQWGEWMDAC